MLCEWGECQACYPETCWKFGGTMRGYRVSIGGFYIHCQSIVSNSEMHHLPDRLIG